MRDYLERMTVPTMTPAPDAAYATIVAANGPKMTALAAELADGVLPAGLPPEYTAQARKALGPDKLLVIAIPVITDTADLTAAREQARQSAATMLARPPYAASIARLGYPAGQIAAVSDDLVQALVAHGDPDAIAAAAAAHLAAGADHVVLMPSAAVQRDLMTGVEQLERLAPAVLQVR